MSILGGINVFTNRAAGGSRLQPLRQPARAPSRSDYGSCQPLQICKQRVRKNGNWTDEQLRKALAAVDDGQSMKKAAEENHIPYSSFHDWYYGKTRSRKRGVKVVLSPKEEAQIVDFLIKMYDRGYGLSP
jgi:hypothetical protein